MSPENSKPEWFHMADADPIPATPKNKKGIRMMALATPLLVLGAGFVYAQSQNSPGTTASAVTPISTATTAVSTPTTAATAPVTTQHTSLLSSTSVKASSTTLAKPRITLPTGSGEND